MDRGRVTPLERAILVGQAFADGIDEDDNEANYDAINATNAHGRVSERLRLPAVNRNIASLRYLLHSRRFDLPANAVDVPLHLNQEQVRKLVRRRFQPANDIPAAAILFYFAGHAVVRGNPPRLYLLANPESTFQSAEDDGIDAAILLEIIAQSMVALRVIILDCCNAAHGLEAALSKAIAPEPDKVTGTYAVAASRLDVPAKAPPGQLYTNFSGELIDVLERGLDNGLPYLSLDEIFKEVKARVSAKYSTDSVVIPAVDGGSNSFAANAYYGLSPLPLVTTAQSMFELQIKFGHWLDRVRDTPGLLPEGRLTEVHQIVRSGRYFVTSLRARTEGVGDLVGDDIDLLSEAIGDAEEAIDRCIAVAGRHRVRASGARGQRALRTVDNDNEVLIERKRALTDSVESCATALRQLRHERRT